MSDVKQHLGVWLPAHEAHMSQWMTQRMQSHPQEMVDGRGTYQYHKQTAAIKFTRNFRVAVDVGGHCGMWSMQLAKRFEHVLAFEPVALHRKCFDLNMALAPVRTNYQLYPYALGNAETTVGFHTSHGSSGDSWVEGDGDVPVRRFDDVFTTDPLPVVDLVKLDCEGYELFALQGMEQMLLRCRPCVIVEQKPGRAVKYGLGQTDAIPYLESLGAKLRKEMSGDYILSWDELQVITTDDVGDAATLLGLE